MLKTNLLGKLSLLLLTAVLAAGCGSSEKPGEAARASSPPVLLITLDGFGAERLAAFGGESSAPAIERLVESGVAWTDTWTACPMTRPGVATYLTGITPDRHGVRDDLFTPLGEEWPTLAAALSAKGYHTAAFPDSNFLGSNSGLLRGFAVVDEPPQLPIGPDRWIPVLREPDELAEHFALWLNEVPAGEGYFAWLHFSGMMRQQFVLPDSSAVTDEPVAERLRERNEQAQKDGTDEEGEPASERGAAKGGERGERTLPIETIDAAIGSVLAALELRGDAGNVVILVAGTSATLGRKAEIGGRGPGFSLEEGAVRVPLIARFPTGAGTPRAADQPVWAPDVPATIAQIGGVALAAEAEGISLFDGVDEERTLFAWSWATLDQMGWLPLRAARRGEWKHSEGWETRTFRLDGAEADPDAGVGEELAEAIHARTPAERVIFDPSVLEVWAQEHDLKLRPASLAGRDFGPEESRRHAARLLWRGRAQYVIQRPMKSLNAFERVLERDPENLAALLDRGQLLTLAQQEKDALPLLRKAVELYPYNTEAWHWLAHAVWQDSSWEEAFPVLEAILPFQPNDADVLYDLACANSLAGDQETAAGFLVRAIQAGFNRWNYIDTDPDLRNLRASPRYSEVMREYGP